MRIAVVALVVFFALPEPCPSGTAKHEVFIDAPTQFSPDSKASLRVAVFESTGLFKLKPLENASVIVTLVGRDQKKTGLLAGVTDRSEERRVGKECRL